MDDKKRTARYWIAFFILAVFLVILFVWNVNAGSIHLSVSEILNIIFRHQGDATAYNIIWEIRLPRILSVIILGGALSVSGFLLQTFFNNPIAGPFVLGISSGAKLVVALLMIYFLSRSISMGSAAMIIAAFIGSMISMGFVLLVAKKVHNMSMLVISGVMIGYICSAVTDFVVTFADDSNIVNLHNWSLGSFSGMSWGNVKVMATVVLLTMVIVFFMSKPIGAYQLGEVYAQNMGVNIKLFRIGLILLSSILSACVTAFAGPISFVGIAVPHIVKSLLKTARPLLVIPACFLGGAVFCLFCDLIARTVFAPTELSISSVTAVFGAPVVIYIMIRRQKRNRYKNHEQNTLTAQIIIRCSIKRKTGKNMSEKIADVIKETENNKADRQEQYFFRTDQLTVGYDGKPLIREINIQLKKGEILTLIGPNGAGKSTILKSITRQLATISGTVYLDKEKMAKMTNKEVSQKLAVVLTERMRPELMTCEDIVATGRYPYTGTLGILSAEDKTKVKKSMETVHAWDLKDRDFTAISDGQRQRILLARAICQEPEIIVLDEPTSFLDIRHKLELLTILKQMVLDHQLTVIMSLHELDLAQKISDKVICVHGEYIEKYGAPEEIFTSEYIRKLYGITRGSYNAAFGCVEMDPPRGEPQVFVIGGNGSGIPYYRKLQRQGIPFAAGVLHTNDVDCQVAGALADQVITEKPFESISQESYDKAVELMKKCQKVICPLKDFGTVNAANRELLRLARELGILAEL